MAGSRVPPPGGASTGELDRLRGIVATYFPVYETRVGPQSVLFSVQTDPRTLRERFEALRRELIPQQYVPFLRYRQGEHFIEIGRRPTPRPFGRWVNYLLLAATAVTTVFAGSLIYLAYVEGTGLTWTDVGGGAAYFAVPVLAILGFHELAHYVVARRRGLDASLPFFIPIPPPADFGTLGAFINIREPFPDRQALFDIGVAGPLAGLVTSVPILLGGFYLSAHAPAPNLAYCAPTILATSYGNLIIGFPLILEGLAYFFPSSLLSLHPLLLAGWVGVFVTAINLLPAGQLDGGHVFRALLGDRSRYLSYAVIGLLLILTVFYIGWFIFAVLVLLFGVRHPPPLNDVSPLDRKRYALGIVAAAILVGGIAIVPLSLPPGNLAITNTGVSPISPPPGLHVAVNLTVAVTNQDPIVHAFSFTAAIVGATVNNTTLSGPALANYSRSSVWIFYLPNGNVTRLDGSSVTTDPANASSIAAGATASVTVTLLNPVSANALVVVLGASEYCATSGTGSASTQFDLTSLG